MLGDIDAMLSGLSKLHALQTKGTAKLVTNLVRFEEAQCIAKHNVEPWDKHNDPNIVQLEPSRMDVAARHAQLSDQSIKPPAAQLSNNVPVTKRQRLIAAKSRGLDAACQKLKECAGASATSSQPTRQPRPSGCRMDASSPWRIRTICTSRASAARSCAKSCTLLHPRKTGTFQKPRCVSPRVFRMGITLSRHAGEGQGEAVSTKVACKCVHKRCS